MPDGSVCLISLLLGTPDEWDDCSAVVGAADAAAFDYDDDDDDEMD